MLLSLKDLSYVYSKGTPLQTGALKNINLDIEENSFIGLIGHTGSGKSTLIQHMNGLIKATSGDVIFEGRSIYEKGYDLKDLRCNVGLVFQYPEHQLFEETVFKDVSFGPTNQGLSEEEIKARVENALRIVGIGEEYWNMSPFELSGGEKRRVAIAGVMAMQPKVLILDEPTAGLDPKTKNSILGQIKQIHEEVKITVILVSHSMEDVAEYVDRIIVMNDGNVMYDDEPKKVFSHYKELEKIGLAAPAMTYIMNKLRENGFDVSTDIITVEEATKEILNCLNKEKQC
ncbi:MAG: energy-coupling factor transporter ATPase [Parasporobacterium sp.]|nr:energy-coupling factor transporter ATPase [Parasporobacterium sp.]